MEEGLPSFNSNTAGDINGRGNTYLEHPLLLVILMEEELLGASATTDDITIGRGRGTTIAYLVILMEEEQ